MADVSVQYNKTTQTITCTSTGGPATHVSWYKDDAQINMASNEGRFYENSQIIMDTISATYENRLRIVDKSSEAAGTYTCEVRNPKGSRNETSYLQGKIMYSMKTAVLYDKHFDQNYRNSSLNYTMT